MPSFSMFITVFIVRNIAPIRINKFTCLINYIEYYQSPIVLKADTILNTLYWNPWQAHFSRWAHSLLCLSLLTLQGAGTLFPSCSLPFPCLMPPLSSFSSDSDTPILCPPPHARRGHWCCSALSNGFRIDIFRKKRRRKSTWEEIENLALGFVWYSAKIAFYIKR